MDISATPHFRQYVENKYVESYKAALGYSEQRARDTFKDKFYDDFITLAWILQSLFSNTKREGDNYLFITEPMIHVILSNDGGKTDYHGVKINKNNLEVGKMTFWLEGLTEMITFENKAFVHGHVGEGPQIGCFGGYSRFFKELTKTGFSGALMQMYNFCRVSHYNTKMNGVYSDKW